MIYSSLSLLWVRYGVIICSRPDDLYLGLGQVVGAKPILTVLLKFIATRDSVEWLRHLLRQTVKPTPWGPIIYTFETASKQISLTFY